MKNKYNARKTLGYDSKMEADYFAELEQQERAGEILNLSKQVRVPLRVHGQLIAHWRADGSFELPDGRRILYEVKGFETDVWRIKKKLVLALLDAGELNYDEVWIQYKGKKEEWVADARKG